MKRLLAERKGRASGGVEPRGPDAGPAPLTAAQERLWFLERLHGGDAGSGGLYNITRALRFDGPLDAAALAAALGRVVERHQVLRSAVEAEGESGVQRVLPTGRFELPLTDLSALPAALRPGVAARLARREARRPFDLAAGPLLRARLLHRAADEHTLLVAVHHLAFDGASMALLLDELAAAYAAARDGAEPGLTELPYQFGDYAAWERGRLEEGGFDAVLDWWRGTIGEPPPPLELPADRPRPAAPSLEAASVAVDLPADLAAALAARARDGGARPFVVFLAAWSALLARVAGAERAVVGFPAANREVAGSEALIGFFVNTLPAV
ncbi:MAG TPA: condensation domain-containing protein, partial [Thermoanaerobaculia bacterium]|nr:condensation domain-containing protein [Thermoanaerobaculia bacterium]